MQSADEIRESQKQAWGAAASGWERNDTWYRRNFAPVIEWLCRAVEPVPGRRMLDIGCGAGQPALPVAARLRPGGSLIGIDLSPEMLAVASRLARAADIENVEFKEMGAEQLGFADASFEGVTCSFALMFCPDVARAVGEMHRVLKSDGRVAIAVWDEPGKNPFLTTVGGTVGRFVSPGSPPPAPADLSVKAPGPFRLAPASELEGVLRAAGFVDVVVESQSMAPEFASADEHWRIVIEQAGGLAKRVASLPEAKQAELRAAVRAAMAPHSDADGRIRVTATALCARARKP